MHTKPRFWVSFKTRFIISTAVSNFLVIFVTIVEDATLEDVAKVFWFQTFVVFLLNLCRILSAEYVGDRPSPGPSKSILGAKVICLLMFILMNGLFLAGSFAAIFLWLNAGDSLSQTIIFLAMCSALFLANQFILFKNERAIGLHKQLLDDAELVKSVYRILLVMIPMLLFLSTKRNLNIDYTFGQFVLVLLIIAIVDSAFQIVRAEEYHKKARSLAPRGSDG